MFASENSDDADCGKLKQRLTAFGLDKVLTVSAINHLFTYYGPYISLQEVRKNKKQADRLEGEDGATMRDALETQLDVFDELMSDDTTSSTSNLYPTSHDVITTFVAMIFEQLLEMPDNSGVRYKTR